MFTKISSFFNKAPAYKIFIVTIVTSAIILGIYFAIYFLVYKKHRVGKSDVDNTKNIFTGLADNDIVVYFNAIYSFATMDDNYISKFEIKSRFNTGEDAPKLVTKSYDLFDKEGIYSNWMKPVIMPNIELRDDGSSFLKYDMDSNHINLFDETGKNYGKVGSIHAINTTNKGTVDLNLFYAISLDFSNLDNLDNLHKYILPEKKMLITGNYLVELNITQKIAKFVRVSSFKITRDNTTDYFISLRDTTGTEGNIYIDTYTFKFNA